MVIKSIDAAQHQRASRAYNSIMSEMSHSQFQAIAADWQSTSDAVAKAESDAARAFALFHRTGDESLLRDALAARQGAHDRMRRLMQRVWSRFGLNAGTQRARQASPVISTSESR